MRSESAKLYKSTLSLGAESKDTFLLRGPLLATSSVVSWPEIVFLQVVGKEEAECGRGDRLTTYYTVPICNC